MKDIDQYGRRPELTKDIAVEDFRSFYWLKKELVQFCCESRLSTMGGKREIQERIERFLKFDTTPIAMEPKRKQSKENRIYSESIEFRLDCIIPAHFRCTREARDFLVSHAGPGFRYTVRLQQFIKANSGITFRDLIKEWELQREEKKAGQEYEIGSQFEYNQFTRDYFNDPDNKNKTKVDCIEAWNEIKVLRGDRKYRKRRPEV